MSKFYHLIPSPDVAREANSRRRPAGGSGRRRPDQAGVRPPVAPARKRWGQHFLASPEAARRIVEAARLGAGDTVLEVGPGDGALTRPILATGARLVAVEIDPLRAEALAREFAGRANVAILHGDAMEKPYAEWLGQAGAAAPAVLVANLPYNVATPLLTRAIEEPEAIARAVATVQREVARRFAAGPDDEEYGFLSVRAAAFSRARVLFDLPPSLFRPRPKVVSSVLELMPRTPPLDPVLRRRAVALASLAFRSRRKTLGNALASVAPRARWEELLEDLGKSPSARAEELSLDDFLALAAKVTVP
ncbi:MAG TPA: 16S rRNA (adenine(1518)-N(6)/adenine(1519)-N(6))-dimethyltransferase RsmA [Thermoanaerobaculia bacterium]|nr:16S rRNA (adenine(1518)-N(6)/adenine(1519)-N(6))-dimethyltransferase RsmA [Thermoanaerobaculia bacterium]